MKEKEKKHFFCYLLKSLEEQTRESERANVPCEMAASGAIFYSCSNFMDYNEFYMSNYSNKCKISCTY